jgi:uncharacterized protein (TIRG00374 family)
MKLLNNNVVKFSAKLLISLAFVAWLIIKINWREVLANSAQLTLGGIVLYVALLIFGMAISSYKWQILAKFKGFDLPLKKYFQLYLTGTFLNNFFPSFIGGDTYRAYQIGKQDKKYISATATVVMDRVTGLLSAMFLSVVFAAMNWRLVSQHHVLVLIISIVVFILIGVLCMGFIVKFTLWKKMAWFVPKKVLEVIKDFAQYQGSAELREAFFVTIFYSFIGLALVNYVLFWAIGINVGILDFLTVIFLVNIVSSIPVSVNNIGIKEWAYVTFFAFLGVSASAVVTIAIISRVLQMLVSFVALPMYLKSKKTE